MMLVHYENMQTTLAILRCPKPRQIMKPGSTFLADQLVLSSRLPLEFPFGQSVNQIW